MKRIGVAFTGGHDSVDVYVDGARKAESEGYERILLAEDYFFRDTLTTATLIGAETEDIDIGLFVNPFTRSPALTAMSVASLDEITGGRVHLSVGAGPGVVMEQFVNYESPLWSVKYSIDLLRKLLAEDSVTFDDGIFDYEDVTLGECPYMPYMGTFEFPREEIPIYVAAVGPQMLKMTGDIGDGLLVSVGFTPEMVSNAMKQVHKGLAMSNRSREDFDVAGLVFTSSEITPRARQFTALTIGTVHDDDSILASGIPKEGMKRVQKRFEESGLQAATETVTDEMVETYVLTGDGEIPLDERLDQYLEAGVDIPILIHLGPDDPTEVVAMGAEWAQSEDDE